MRQIMLLCLGLFFLGNEIEAQSDFSTFVSYFPSKSLTDPIFNISTNKTSEFLLTPEIPVRLYNKLTAVGTPFVRLLDGTTENVDFIGMIDEEGIEYEKYDNEGNLVSTGLFYSKIHPLARIDLRPNYVTLVGSIRSLDRTSLYAFSFNSNGELLSAIYLFSADATSEEAAIFGNTLWNFSIEADGKILQKYNGLDFYRERRYQLNDDGCFEVVWENVVNR